jgi:hypothetical protein
MSVKFSIPWGAVFLILFVFIGVVYGTGQSSVKGVIFMMVFVAGLGIAFTIYNKFLR